MELAAALAALVALDLLRRTGRDMVRKVDVTVLGADAFLHPSERLPVRGLARVAVVHERGLAVGPGRSQPRERSSGGQLAQSPRCALAEPQRQGLENSRRKRLDLFRPRPDSNEEADVEIDRERKLRLDVPTVPRGRRRERVQDEAESL